ncbi:MAG: hypothetical protein PVJ57_13025 [Phycisphaerae bacterium]|jgi:hypothetical protein
MMPSEKERLLALLEREASWSQGAEAHGVDGRAVCYDDEAAVAWDLTGALCRLFGWQRACVLFGQFDRHIHGKRSTFTWPKRNAELDAMVALQEYNDRRDTTFTMLRERIESMPVWRGDSPPQVAVHDD